MEIVVAQAIADQLAWRESRLVHTREALTEARAEVAKQEAEIIRLESEIGALRAALDEGVVLDLIGAKN